MRIRSLRQSKHYPTDSRSYFTKCPYASTGGESEEEPIALEMWVEKLGRYIIDLRQSLGHHCATLGNWRSLSKKRHGSCFLLATLYGAEKSKPAISVSGLPCVLPYLKPALK